MDGERHAFLVIVYAEPTRIVVEELSTRDQFAVASAELLGSQLVNRVTASSMVSGQRRAVPATRQPR